MIKHLRHAGKLLRLIAHLFSGLAVITLRFPRLNKEQKRHVIQRWSIKLIDILQLEVRVQGVAPEREPHHHLLVANHISWLDIFVFNAVSVSRFVAKADIEGWPIIGRLCCAAGTLFIERASRKDTARVNKAMMDALNEGDCVAVFPEGTTSDGSRLLPFRSSLMQAAIDTKATIQPVYLRYLDQHGLRTTRTAYVDDVSLLSSVWLLVSSPGLVAELNFLAPMVADHENRREITRRIEQHMHEAQQALNGAQNICTG